MTEYDPEPVADELSEVDFVDQHTDIEDELQLDTDELADEAWSADIADVADQHIPAPVDEDDV